MNSEKDTDHKPKIYHDKSKSLSLSSSLSSGTFTSSNLFASNLHTPKDSGISQTEGNERNTDEEENKQTDNDGSNTFDLFVNRLSKLQTRSQLPNYEPTRHSEKSHGIVKGFAVSTNQGLVRNYNEDRVSIVLNILRPSTKDPNEYWPNCSIFGVFDGHGGAKCAEFLRNNLHHYIIKSRYFPWNPTEALKEAFEEADRIFLESADTEEEGKHDKSGSCATVLLVVDETCYICNLGDSRAILSQSGGASRMALTRDHKPSDKLEQKRVIDGGGKVYQNFPLGANGKRLDLDPKTNPFKVVIPFRILPGRLSVSRAFGDIEAKFEKYGGNPNVLIAKPEITTLKINKEHDFIILGCDGIYDKMTNEDTIGVVWDTMKKREAKSIHDLLKVGVENIVKDSLLRKSLDNVTAIIIAFSSLEYKFSHFDEKDSRPLSKHETRTGQSRLELRKSEDFNNAPVTKFPTTTTAGGHQSHHSVGSLNHMNSQMNGTFDPLRLKTPIKNTGFLSDLTNKFDMGKAEHIRKSSANLPKLSYMKTPRAEFPK
jgi:protein phosphatase 2C family protein 2/3